MKKKTETYPRERPDKHYQTANVDLDCGLCFGELNLKYDADHIYVVETAPKRFVAYLRCPHCGHDNCVDEWGES